MYSGLLFCGLNVLNKLCSWRRQLTCSSYLHAIDSCSSTMVLSVMTWLLKAISSTCVLQWISVRKIVVLTSNYTAHQVGSQL